MKIELYDHNSNISMSNEIITKVLNAIENFKFEIHGGNGCSKKLREKLKNELLSLGWSDEVELDANSRITITSINENYGLCLQTGNMSRFYADLIKLEYLYKREKIKGALFILPSKSASKILGSNIANFHRLTQELSFFKNVITTPIKVIGIS